MIRAILHNVSIWIVVIPFLLGCINFKGLNRDSRWIFLLVTVALVPQLMTAFVKNDDSAFNIAYNLYTPIEFFIFCVVFRSKFRTRRERVWFSGWIFGYLIICAIYFTRFGIEKAFLGELVAINNVLYIVWILAIFRQEFTEEVTFIEVDYPFTWYLVALLVYAPCTVMTHALYHYLRNRETPVFQNLLIIQDIFNILLYILFAVGLVMRSKDSPRSLVQP